MNSLDERYGSTYRIRAFADELSKLGHSVSYYEKKMPFVLKSVDMFFSALFQSYDHLMIQKFNPLTVPCIIAAKIRGKSVIVDWDDWDTGLQSNLVNKALTWICEWIGPRLPDMILSHNAFLLKSAPSGKKTMLLPQGYDPALFQNRQSKQELRKNMELPQGKVLVGYMCTFTRGGTLDLRDIMNTLSKVKNPDIHILMIGGGDLLAEFQTYANELKIRGISFTGHVPHKKIPQYLSSLDIGLVYMNETRANLSRVSFKTVEYLASGVQVIGQTVGETKALFSSQIHEVPLNQLPDFLNHLSKEQMPVISSNDELLKPYQWSKIIGKLQPYLTGEI